MSFIQILQIIAALATIATGLFSLLAPRKVTGFTGLEPVGGRGVTEIRAVLGALFIALGAAPFLVGATAYRVLGIGYLGIAAVRAVSMFIDRSVVRSNVISLVTEIVLGVVLVL
jgi:hypothetical protein